MKMMQGAFFLAVSNMSRTRAAPTDEHFNEVGTRNCEEGTPASPAIALASSVLPVPGSPRAARRADAAAQTLVLRRIAQEVDDFLHVFPWLRRSLQRPFEANLVVLLGEHAGLGLPKEKAPPPPAPPCMRRMKRSTRRSKRASGTKIRKRGQEGRFFLSLAVHLNAVLTQVVDHPKIARTRDGVLSSGLRRDEDLATLHLHFADLARLSVIHKLGVARLIERLRRVGLKLAENREEHHRDENPYGNAGKDLLSTLNSSIRSGPPKRFTS